MYKQAFRYIDEFYKTKHPEELLQVLNNLLSFNSAYVFFVNPSFLRLEYAWNGLLSKNEYTISHELSEELFQGIFSEKFDEFIRVLGIDVYCVKTLQYKNTVFGILLIEGKELNTDEQILFQACASIVANIIKDVEINKIMSMQIKALQDGILKTKQAEKIKTGFISHISHEIRTPLNSILGYADLLDKEFVGTLNSKQKEFIHDIQISGIHLMGMINEVLDWAKLEACAMRLNLMTFDLKLLIEEVCNIVYPLLHQKNINLIMDDVVSVEITADYQKIRQILFNLLSNAIKFTPVDGKIVIKVLIEQAVVGVSVCDNGYGIAPENQERIFEKFSQISNDNGEISTGLGLAITKEFIELHGGSIELNSELGQGAEFVVMLPRKDIKN